MRMALGRGKSPPKRRKKSRAALGWIAVIGEPWETKTEGMRSDMCVALVCDCGERLRRALHTER